MNVHQAIFSNNYQKVNQIEMELLRKYLDYKKQALSTKAIAANSLQEVSEQTLQEVSEIKLPLNTAASVTITDTNGAINYVNDNFCQICKYSREELIGKTHPLINSNYHSREFFDELWNAIKAGKIWQGDIKNKAKDGSCYWVDTTIVPLLNEGGKPYQYLFIILEITRRQELEEKVLRDSENTNLSLIRVVPDLMFKLSSEGVFLDYYPTKDDGRSPSDFIGKKVEEVFSTDLGYWTNYHLKQTLLTGESQIGEYVFQIDGKWLHCEARYLPSGTDEVVGIVRDITHRKQREAALLISEIKEKERALQLEKTLQELQQTQAQLILAEKMSTIAQMVAGIAHEINNPINFIYGNINYAEEYILSLLEIVELYVKHYPVPKAEIQELTKKYDLEFLREDLPGVLKSMKLGSERIRELVASMLNFYRLGQSHKKKVDIHSGIDSTLLLLQNRLQATEDRTGITVIKKYGDLPLVECYPGLINQVFMNVIANAIDAIEDANKPGVILIETSFNTDFVLISISDNGPGISDSTKQRLFDPFFTTKPVGKGTGLGMSISYQIVVEKHGGKLRCFSEIEEGTTWEILIPVTTGRLSEKISVFSS